VKLYGGGGNGKSRGVFFFPFGLIKESGIIFVFQKKGVFSRISEGWDGEVVFWGGGGLAFIHLRVAFWR